MAHPLARRYVAFVAALMGAVRIVIGVLLVLSVLLNFANVIGRYVFRRPIVGAEEVMAFLMIAIVFLAFGVVAWEGRHIKMDLILELAAPALRRPIAALSEITAIVVAAILIWIGLPVVERLFAFHQVSQAASVPLWLPQAMIPIGMALMILGVSARLLQGAPPQSSAAHTAD